MAEQGFVEEEFSFDDFDAEPADDGHGHDHGMQEPGMETHDMPDDMPMDGGGKSISLEDLVELAHIHLISFSFILFFVGVLACLSGWSERTKSLLIGILATCLLMDIGGLFLVRFVNQAFAPFTFIGGAGIGVCLLITAARALWEMWGPEPA